MRSFLRNPVHWLLLAVPAALILGENEGVPPAAAFGVSALAIVPLAALLVRATEQIAERTGPAIGGLLNATFGNAPELIIALVALRSGELDLVKASLVGCILGNLLFVLGLAFLVGGLRHHEQLYNAAGARAQSSVLLIAALSFLVPSLFHSFLTPETSWLEQRLNTAVAEVLLAVYALSLVFMLRTHPDYFTAEAVPGAAQPHEEADAWSPSVAGAVLVGSSVALAFVSEVLVGSVGETASALGMSKVFVGVILLATVGGAAECLAAVAMARKNKIDLSVGIAVGSSTQIALFVAPVLVLASYAIAPRPLDLVMGDAGVAIVFVAVLCEALIAGDGHSHWFKGVQLLCIYVLIALFCFYLSDSLVAPASL
jgi:Ca2+:H+ antiporter